MVFMSLMQKTRALALAGALLAASCLPPPPEDQPDPNTSMLLHWTVNGLEPGSRLCQGLSSSPVYLEIWENADFDLVEGQVVCPESPGPDFFIIRFDCDDGTCGSGMLEKIGASCKADEDCCSGSTEPCAGTCIPGMVRTPDFFFSGVPTCIKAVLISYGSTSDAEDIFRVESGEWRAVTPDRTQTCAISGDETRDACFDFGPLEGTDTVNFQLEGFAPLAVSLEWEIVGSAPVEYGPCGASVPAVAHMGYTLLAEDASVIDRVDVGRQVLECTDAPLTWQLAAPGTYSLEVEGRNGERTVSWKGLCTGGLTVPQSSVPLCRVELEEEE
jgi:hypothetical protein